MTPRLRRWLHLLRHASFVAPAEHEPSHPRAKDLRPWRARLILRTLQLSVVVHLLLAGGKVVVGGSSGQPYLLGAGLLSVGVGAAKLCLLLGAGAADARLHLRASRTAGWVLVASALAYTLACGVASRVGGFQRYDRATAIAIAAFTFVEVGTAVTGAVTSRRLWTPLLHANTMINLGAALVGLGLTQVALLSFSEQQDTTRANAVFIAAMGLAAAGIGLAVVLRNRERGKKAGTDPSTRRT